LPPLLSFLLPYLSFPGNKKAFDKRPEKEIGFFSEKGYTRAMIFPDLPLRLPGLPAKIKEIV
jgi:hypothetical protein